MRYDAEHKQRTRTLVLKEAAKAIRLHGPDNIGVAALMAQAGLTHGGFYAHFKSKDDLVAEAVSLMFEEHGALLQACLCDVTPAEGLGRFIDSYLSRQHLQQREIGCPVAALSGELPRLPAAVRARFEAGIEQAVSAVAAVLEMLGFEAPQALARSIQAEMVGAVAVARAMTDVEAGMGILRNSRQQIRARLHLDTA